MRHRVRDILLTATLAAFAGQALLEAQSFTGAMIGSVSDPSGAAVPNEKLTAAEGSSNIVTETQSDLHGDYSFPRCGPVSTSSKRKPRVSAS